MTTPRNRFRAIAVAVVTGAIALLGATACRDSAAVRQKPAVEPITGMEGELRLSTLLPSEGELVRMELGVRSGSIARSVGSFTAQVAYDTTALTFAGTDDLGDGAMVAVNPVSQVVRVAGVAPRGFPGGTLVTLRFTARRRADLTKTAARVDELHATDRTSVLSMLASRELSATLVER